VRERSQSRKALLVLFALTSCQTSFAIAGQHLVQLDIRSTRQRDLSSPVAGVQSYITLINATIYAKVKNEAKSQNRHYKEVPAVVMHGKPGPV
jgi:hypothetical protein